MTRYPKLACEILTSDLWSIPDTVMSNKEALLRPFWDAVLPPISPSSPSSEPSDLFDKTERERARDGYWSEVDEERDRKREVIRGMWMRINAAFVTKRTHEVGSNS
jgi:SIT4-associating protein SAP185/190